MMNSTIFSSPCNVALVDCKFWCLRPTSSSSAAVRLKSGNFKLRASDAEYEAAVFAGSMPETPQDEWGIMCELCAGRGWLVCDFCKGQKTNVKADNKRIYRRCPSCRAVGYILCSKCKVFKCVTFPDASDGVDLIF
ncbi:hypothetical protein ACH5RR_039246 [Cinchona calisaya]|uniref:Uncharacterized protein n=1 Tax=Cinchona calisaya TaxID=153742 RepID=A0ABD2XZ29_9GENT